MKYFEKVAAYEDAIMEKVALSDAEKRKIMLGSYGTGAGVGALNGAVFGGGAGAIYGLLKKKTPKDKDEEGNELSRGDIVRKYAKRGLGVGTLAGTAIGVGAGHNDGKKSIENAIRGEEFASEWKRARARTHF